MNTLEPIMEPVEVAGTMTGTAIIDDLCIRLADRLRRDCNLRGSDSYRSFSARVRVDLWLQDVDTTEVNADLLVGQVESAPPSQTITMGVGAGADQVSESLRLNLERHLYSDDDASASPDAAAPKLPRTYVSRIRTRKSA